MTAPLNGIRALDLTSPQGHLCGRLLADLGAEVVKGGSRPRETLDDTLGPFKGSIPDPEASLPFLYFNANKKSVVIDLATSEGRDKFRDLARDFDAIIETYPPGVLADWGLDYADLKEHNPGLVMASITGFWPFWAS